jgi:hypothetical protein
MSLIKDIYDLLKDGATLATQKMEVKRALKTELKLNRKCLSDIENRVMIDDERRRTIIQMLDIIEISEAMRLVIPLHLFERKKVSEELAAKFKIKRLIGASVEDVIENLYLKISYLKKDTSNNRIDLNLRLINIDKYNRVLLELLK